MQNKFELCEFAKWGIEEKETFTILWANPRVLRQTCVKHFFVPIMFSGSCSMTLFFKHIFSAILDLQKNWEEDTEISHITPASHTCRGSLVISISHQSGTLVKIGEPPLRHNNYPKFIIYIRVHLGIVHSVHLNKCIITCSQHYGLIQSIFMALKILCAPPIRLYLRTSIWQPLAFLQIGFFHLVICM